METVHQLEHRTAECGDTWHYNLTPGPCPSCGDTTPPLGQPDLGALQQVADGLRALPDDGPCCTGPCQMAATPDTIGIEAITDHFRATAYAPGLPGDARVATVWRDGEYQVVLDNDAVWRTQLGDRPVLILARMLATAGSWAAERGAEALMPGPDVLTALTGQAPTPPLTAPVPVIHRYLQPGWHLVLAAAAGRGELARIDGVTSCDDQDCQTYPRCTVLTLAPPADEPRMHRADYLTADVRIPAEVVTR